MINSEYSSIWRYLPFGIYSGFENMAIDELLLEEVIAGNSANTLRFYKWFPSTASIGQHQSLNAEIDLQAAEQYQIDVVRRISGGGAVFHDATGEITYAIICHIKDIPSDLTSTRIYDTSIPSRFHAILESLAWGLESIGIPIDVGAIHCPALIVGGKKISGNAQLIRNGVLLQHGTILLSVQPELMYKILKAPEGVSYTRMVQSVRSKVIGIRDFVQSQDTHQISLSESLNRIKVKDQLLPDYIIVKALKAGFQHIFKATFIEQALSSSEKGQMCQKLQQKYHNIAWTQKYL